MARYVTERVYAELVAAGESGTRIIVDGYCRQQYPNMERWEQTYKLPVSVWSDPAYNAIVEEPLSGLTRDLIPDLDVHAEGEAGPVFVSVREADGVRYVVVVNNSRQPGPYTEWTKNPGFKPYGRAQSATVSIKAPEGAAVYEFTESKRLTPGRQGDRISVTVDLPPHAGRAIAVYPAELEKIRIMPERRHRLGQSAVIRVAILDSRGNPAPGRQLIRAVVRDPRGRPHDESGLYATTAGKVELPFRPALNDTPGDWRIEVSERTSGLAATEAIRVE
jgi:hypothetical protein